MASLRDGLKRTRQSFFGRIAQAFGQCAEASALVYYLMKNAGIADIRLMAVTDHAFVVWAALWWVGRYYLGLRRALHVPAEAVLDVPP